MFFETNVLSRHKKILVYQRNRMGFIFNDKTRTKQYCDEHQRLFAEQGREFWTGCFKTQFSLNELAL
jgi:hypothetical protein